MAGVFDKMVVGINRGINTVSENSKLMVEKAQINTAIHDAEKERELIYRNMGELVYNLQADGVISISQCQNMCNEILKIDNKISEFQIQIQNLNTQRKTYQEQESNQTVDSSEYVRCECGFNNKKVAKFCAQCGNKIVLEKR